MKLYEKKFEVNRLFGGLIEWDPHWRSRQMMLAQEGGRLDVELTKAEMLAMMPCETAIEYLGGLPGGGKSLLSCKLIFDELVNGHRPIVTNLAINVARLQEYLHECGHAVHLERRLYILEKHEVKEFYFRRTATLKIERGDSGTFVDWEPTQNDDQAAGGVFYVIDECHNYFHPGAFEKEKMTPEHPLFQWASQHRKLKDRCYFVTQSIENVHVSIRRLGQQFHYVRNLRKETHRGFRRGDGFIRTTYLKQPKTESAVPIEETPFRLDVRGLASCYWTAGGVGIASKGVGDGGFQKKGLHMRWLWGAAALACVLVVLALLIGPKALVALVTHNAFAKTPSTKMPAQSAEAAALPSLRSQKLAEPKLAIENPELRKSNPHETHAADLAPTVFVVGFTGSLARNRYAVYLSDGRTYTEEDGLVTFIGRGSAVIAGKRYFRGSGAKGAPVRRDGAQRLGDGPPAAVSANVPIARRSVEDKPSVAVVASAKIESQPPSSNSGAWYTDQYGIQRLTVPPRIGQ